jgi:hypothetical protein
MEHNYSQQRPGNANGCSDAILAAQTARVHMVRMARFTAVQDIQHFTRDFINFCAIKCQVGIIANFIFRFHFDSDN